MRDYGQVGYTSASIPDQSQSTVANIAGRELTRHVVTGAQTNNCPGGSLTVNFRPACGITTKRIGYSYHIVSAHNAARYGWRYIKVHNLADSVLCRQSCPGSAAVAGNEDASAVSHGNRIGVIRGDSNSIQKPSSTTTNSS